LPRGLPGVRLAADLAGRFAAGLAGGFATRFAGAGAAFRAAVFFFAALFGAAFRFGAVFRFVGFAVGAAADLRPFAAVLRLAALREGFAADGVFFLRGGAAAGGAGAAAADGCAAAGARGFAGLRAGRDGFPAAGAGAELGAA
jgi:hypothetical protein